MTRKIRNFDELVSHGERESREIVLAITEATLQRLDSYRRIQSMACLKGTTLHIGTKSWDLSKKKNVYLLGAGKACNAMAMAVEEILGDQLTRGIAIVKVAEPRDVFKRTEVYVGGHPLPNEEGHRASKEILKLIDGAGPEDLFIGVISGGSSALMSCPIDGITLQDEIRATDVLLKCGAGIFEINAIRRHISQLNGGMLAKRVERVGAELIGLAISDGIGVPATGDVRIPCTNYSSTPIGPDKTTLDDARGVIRNYDLADKLPPNIVRYLMNAGPEAETPKAFPNNTYFLVNSVADSCIFAKEEAEKLGLPALILTSVLEGESKDAGTLFAAIAKEVQARGTPIKAPCVILSAGETTTKIEDNAAIAGHGGPSQELTASFAIAATRAPGACMLSIDSEGTDGTTSVAGGITDSASHAAAVRAGVDLHAALRGHATYEALSMINGAVFTGNTGTNVCDFNVLYVPPLD